MAEFNSGDEPGAVEALREQHVEPEQRQVWVDDDAIVVNDEHGCRVALVRCDTPEKLLWWVLRLSELDWMTVERLNAFVRLAARHNHVEIDQRA